MNRLWPQKSKNKKKHIPKETNSVSKIRLSTTSIQEKRKANRDRNANQKSRKKPTAICKTIGVKRKDNAEKIQRKARQVLHKVFKANSKLCGFSVYFAVKIKEKKLSLGF